MTQTGAEQIRWDFSDLYTSENDPRIMADIEALVAATEAFQKKYRGHLATQLGHALQDMCALLQQQSPLVTYLGLRSQVETDNESLKKVFSVFQEKISYAWGVNLTFFDHEIAQLDEATIEKLMAEDEVVAHHKPYLEDVRRYAQYMLAENVEEALAKRAPFGVSEWDDFVDEKIASLVFEFEGESLKMEPLLDIVSRDQDPDRRAAAMACFNAGLKEQGMDKAMARAWNVVMGAKMLENADRGYASAMAARHLDNKVDEETVQALHDAVEEVAAPLAQRFYRLKARLLGMEKLRWSDRNAPLPITDTTTIPWEEGFKKVKEAFASFSPTLRGFVDEIEQNGWIDAPVYKGKNGGAFCAGFCFKGKDGASSPRSYVLLNHLGTLRDFTTLAHELGHGVHNMLAIPAQNALMCDPPMVYAETASIFAEMVTFQHLLQECDSDESRLSLYMDKANDFVNSVVRQISFSYLEQATHAKRAEGKLTTEEISSVWKDVTVRFYGEEGDVFTYENMENMWSYVHHFMRPFYVYAYAFGELFTQSLYAVKDTFGDDFEPMYLDLLRAGSTKDAKALMAPFGLDPKDPAFWVRGIEASFGVWLEEAEKIADKLGY